MANALQTGVTGLNSHSQMLEIIGNNIANVNTTGYKSRRAVFSDLVYQNLHGASGGLAVRIGGINPAQVGSGSRLSQIAINLQQGNFESTGDVLDMAIDGGGYFTLASASGTVYTRAGAFRVDENGTLVDPGNGFRVQRFGPIGSPGTSTVTFQSSSDNDIKIPYGASIPGQATTEAKIRGNLPARATGALPQTLQSPDPLTTAGNPATASTLLNSLDLNLVDYIVGDTIQINGTDVDGGPVLSTFAVGPTTTLGDLVTAIDAAFAGATASLDGQGRIQLQANATGPAFLSMALRDGTANTGVTNLANARLVVTTEGKNADVFRSSLQVFDSRGTSHQLQIELERQNDGSWNLNSTLPPTSGTVIDGLVTGLRFNDDGTFALASGTGTGDPTVTVQFVDQSQPQDIQFSFGTPGTYDGLTSIDAEAFLAADQDGYRVGSLVSVRVNADGVIEGIASNGVRIQIAQIAVASFANPSGLESRGQSYLGETVNSGTAVIGGATGGGRGTVRSGELEQSNVDLAYEFTRLIVAQRGFSANARTITVADEVLQELTGLIR